MTNRTFVKFNLHQFEYSAQILTKITSSKVTSTSNYSPPRSGPTVPHTEVCKSDKNLQLLNLCDIVVIKLQLSEALQSNQVINILNSCTASAEAVSR